jgi:catechol 2,3-dioxygenase-like lactoylglutathione lyase family enzyme
MPRISGFDHVAITVSDIDAACRFYRDLLGAETVAEYKKDGKVLVRQINLGGARLSVHQAGNGIDLVARRPTAGAADICMRWDGEIDSVVDLMQRKGVEIVEGPSPRENSEGVPSHSVYIRDLDGNLVELMAAD